MCKCGSRCHVSSIARDLARAVVASAFLAISVEQGTVKHHLVPQLVIPGKRCRSQVCHGSCINAPRHILFLDQDKLTIAHDFALHLSPLQTMARRRKEAQKQLDLLNKRARREVPKVVDENKDQEESQLWSNVVVVKLGGAGEHCLFPSPCFTRPVSRDLPQPSLNPCPTPSNYEEG